MKKWIWLIGIAFILYWPQSVIAQEIVSSDGKATILLIDKLSVEDLNPDVTPGLCQLIDKGSLGLCSNRTLGKGSSEDGCLTIGAGNLASASRIVGFNFNEMTGKGNQTGAQLYQNLSGIDPGNNEVLLINLPEILAGMLKNKVTTRPGMLGETLRNNQVDVYVLGNADINGYEYRPAVAVAMDVSGRVSHGNVGCYTSKEVADSYITTRSNYGFLLEQIKRLNNQPGIKIVDLSDLARMEKTYTASLEVQLKERQRVLHDIDNFVTQVVEITDINRDLLMVVVPSVSTARIQEKNTFTPLIMAGPAYKQGMLSSNTTRRDYIVANTDIAPSLLDYFQLNIPQEVMIGQPIRSYPDTRSVRLQSAQQISRQGAMVNRVRVPLVKGYVFLQIIIICFTLFCILAKPRFKIIASRLLLAMGVIPLILLIIGAIPASSDWHFIFYAILATIIVTMAVIKLFKGNYFNGLIAVSALTLLILNIDIIGSSSLIQSSVLGYDAMSGARYYGIGNEYVGVLMGSSILLAAALYQKSSQPWVLGLIALFFLSQTYILAAPDLGAQSDGMITAPAAFLVTLILLSEYHLNPKVLLSIVGAVLVSVFAFTIYDMMRPLEIQSHIGRAANQIYHGGWQEGILIIGRKAGMNMKLIRYTIWTRVFIITLLSLAVLVYQPVGAMKMIRDKYPLLFKGFAGILLAAIIGGVINDSGIVCAATTSIYLITPLLMLVVKNLHVVKDYSENRNQ